VHGHTKDWDSPESFVQDADDVAALLHNLQIDSALFIGFSNGGQTLLEMGIRHPAIVRKLVIISAFYKRNGLLPGFFEGMQHATIGNMPALLKSTYLEIPGNDENGLQAMFERDKQRMLHFKDWNDEDLHAIKAPALVIAANRDVATIQHTVEMSQKIPNAFLVILPGTNGSFIGELCTEQAGSKIPAITVALVEDFLGR